MENSPSSIDSLTVDTVNATIRVRVARMWDSINLKSNDVFGFNMQLLDNKDGEIHAVVGPRFMPLFLGKLKEGLIYDIVDFNVAPAGVSYLPFHNPIKIDFTALTKVTEVDNHEDTIPAHKFSFADYRSIVNRTDSVKYLTDVIGVLHHVGAVVNQSVGNGSVTTKRELILYLDCGNRIAATLWGNKTNLIDESTINDTAKTVILTSMTVKNYRGKPSMSSTTATFVYTDLDVAEGSDILKSFRKRKFPAFSSEDVQSKKPTEIISNKCISEIISSDLPSAYEGKIYTFEAKITGLSLDNGWEYLSCNVCKSRISTSAHTNYCSKYDRDVEFPLHRFRLEVIVDDGTASVPILLLDKLAEFVVRQKAESLYLIQRNEVGGAKKVATILEQIAGKTENFHAKVDTYTASAGKKKLTATRISPASSNSNSMQPEQITPKVPAISDSKINQPKGNPRKKNRTAAN